MLRAARFALSFAATAVLIPAAPASARDYCSGTGVPFVAKGDGQVVTHDQWKGEDGPAVAGGRLSFSETYRAVGVDVTFTHGRVEYTAAAGSVFKPGCASVAASPRLSFPAAWLVRGRVDVRAPRRSPRMQGVNTNEGVFYAPSRRRARYTVTRTGKPVRGKSAMTVKTGGPLTLTPYSDIARPHSCRSGETISITTGGRIRGG